MLTLGCVLKRRGLIYIVKVNYVKRIQFLNYSSITLQSNEVIILGVISLVLHVVCFICVETFSGL